MSQRVTSMALTTKNTSECSTESSVAQRIQHGTRTNIRERDRKREKIVNRQFYGNVLLDR